MPTIVSTTVEICVFKLLRGKPRYLLLKRSPKNSRYPGIWQIVTGIIEPRERAIDAAMRELKEETGLQAEQFWTLPRVNVFLAADRDHIHLSPVFVVRVKGDAEPKLSAEHERFVWCSNRQAIDLLPWPGQRDTVEEVHRYFVSRTEESQLTEIRDHPMLKGPTV